jgi:hypothetical protein
MKLKALFSAAAVLIAPVVANVEDDDQEVSDFLSLRMLSGNTTTMNTTSSAYSPTAAPTTAPPTTYTATATMTMSTIRNINLCAAAEVCNTACAQIGAIFMNETLFGANYGTAGLTSNNADVSLEAAAETTTFGCKGSCGIDTGLCYKVDGTLFNTASGAGRRLTAGSAASSAGVGTTFTITMSGTSATAVNAVADNTVTQTDALETAVQTAQNDTMVAQDSTVMQRVFAVVSQTVANYETFLAKNDSSSFTAAALADSQKTDMADIGMQVKDPAAGTVTAQAVTNAPAGVTPTTSGSAAAASAAVSSFNTAMVGCLLALACALK